jgi:hypothetical protein
VTEAAWADADASGTTDELVSILRVENVEEAAQRCARLGFVLEGVHRFGPVSPRRC